MRILSNIHINIDQHHVSTLDRIRDSDGLKNIRHTPSRELPRAKKNSGEHGEPRVPVNVPPLTSKIYCILE